GPRRRGRGAHPGRQRGGRHRQHHRGAGPDRAAMRGIAAAALAAGLALFACKGQPEEEGGGGAAPPPAAEHLSQSEADRGRQACRAYAEQVCRCAGTHEDLKAECDMSGARLEALEMSVRAAMAEGSATAKDRRDLLANVRKIMRGCVEDSSKLVVRGCPLEAGQGEGAAP